MEKKYKTFHLIIHIILSTRHLLASQTWQKLRFLWNCPNVNLAGIFPDKGDAWASGGLVWWCEEHGRVGGASGSWYSHIEMHHRQHALTPFALGLHILQQYAWGNGIHSSLYLCCLFSFLWCVSFLFVCSIQCSQWLVRQNLKPQIKVIWNSSWDIPLDSVICYSYYTYG